MIVFLEFPIVDVKLFTTEGIEATLSKPNWPTPRPFREFVRGFGQVYPRTKGGIKGWVGENYICNAKKAIKFIQVTPFNLSQDLPSDLNNNIRFKIEARYFYFDGYGVGKLELVLSSMPSSLNLSEQTIVDILTHILYKIPVKIRNCKTFDHTFAEGTYLKDIGKYISSLYYWASTPASKYDASLSPALIIPCDPVIVVEAGYKDNIIAPKKSRKLKQNVLQEIKIFQWWEHQSKIWLLNYENQVDKHQKALGRALRIYLMRLHTECESLRCILLKIKDGSIPLIKGTIELDLLQDYLNESTRRISKISKKVNQKYDLDEIEEIAKQTIENITPGEIDQLLKNLSQTRIRKQIYKKTQDFASNYFSDKPPNSHIIISNAHIESLVMGDKFEKISQSTIINRSLVENAFNQTKEQIDEDAANALIEIANEVEKSQNAAAGALLNSFMEEFKAQQSDKSKLRQYWNGLVGILPSLATLASASAKIVPLFM